MSDILEQANKYHTILFCVGSLVDLAVVLTSSYLIPSRGHTMTVVTPVFKQNEGVRSASKKWIVVVTLRIPFLSFVALTYSITFANILNLAQCLIFKC